MAVVRLTDRTVAALAPPPSGRAELRDAVVKGLVLRVTSGGARSWSVQSVLHGQKVRLTLGRYPALGLAEARRLAQQALRDLALGGDPRAGQGGDQGEPDPGRAGRRVRGPGLPRLKARAGHRQGETVRSAKERLRLLRGYLGGSPGARSSTSPGATWSWRSTRPSGTAR
jgi:hypothetical protein